MLHPSTFKTATGYNSKGSSPRKLLPFQPTPTCHKGLKGWSIWIGIFVHHGILDVPRQDGAATKKTFGWDVLSFGSHDGGMVCRWIYDGDAPKENSHLPQVFQGQVSHYLLRLPTAPTYENNAAVPTSPNRSHGRTFPQGRIWYQWNMHVRSRATAKGCYIYSIYNLRFLHFVTLGKPGIFFHQANCQLK